MSLPRIATRDEWLAARKELLAEEKELTRRRDALNTARRKLPMVEIEKDYTFDGPNGTVSPASTCSRAAAQLIIYHFMFDPEWDEGCPSCTAGTDELSPGFLEHLHTRDTSYAMVSRAPLAKLERWKAKQGWDIPVVLVVRHRLQLRLRRHDRRVGRPRRLQLPHQGRVRGHGLGLLRRSTSPSRCRVAAASCRSTAACSTPTRSTPGASSRPAARTTSSTSPRSAARRSGRSPRAERPRRVRPHRTSRPVRGEAPSRGVTGVSGRRYPGSSRSRVLEPVPRRDPHGRSSSPAEQSSHQALNRAFVWSAPS